MPQMPEQEARRRFTAARVARLATVDEAGRPHLVPVVFAVRAGPDGAGGSGADGIVMAVDDKPKSTTRLKRLRNIAARPAVSLLVDAYGEDWGRLWWVRADGEARVLPPDAADAADAAVRDERRAALGRLCDKYPQYRDHPPTGPVVAVTVLRWTGWRADPTA